MLGRGEAGLLIDPDDIDGLAAAITTLLCDGELRQRLGSAGRERLGANFTYDRFRDQLWSYLDESSNEPDSRDS